MVAVNLRSANAQAELHGRNNAIEMA